MGYAAVGAASLLVPLYALAIGGGALLVGLLAAAAAFAGVPGALVWGWLVTRVRRRRPFVLVSLGATALALVTMPLLDSPWALLVANSVLWFAVSAAAPVLNLVMVDGHPESVWSGRIAHLQSVQGYGWVAGLLLGMGWTVAATGLLGDAAPRPLFALLAMLAALGLGVVRYWYPEPTTLSTIRFLNVYRRMARGRWGAGRYLLAIPYGPGRVYWALRSLRIGGVRRLSTAPLQRYLAAATLFSIGFAVFWAPMPAYLVAERYATVTVFGLFLAANLGSAVCYGPVGRLADQYDPRLLQTGALLARGILFILPAVLGTVALALPVLAGSFLLVGITWAVIAVTATGLVARLAPAPERGEALGLYAALASVGTGIGSVLGGWVAGTVGYVTTFALAGVVVVGGAALVALGHLTTMPNKSL